MIWQFFILLKKGKGIRNVQGFFRGIDILHFFTNFYYTLYKVQSQIVAQTKRWHNNSVYRQVCKTLVFFHRSSTISKSTFKKSFLYKIRAIQQCYKVILAKLCGYVTKRPRILQSSYLLCIIFSPKIQFGLLALNIAKSNDMIKYGLFTKQLQ